MILLPGCHCSIRSLASLGAILVAFQVVASSSALQDFSIRIGADALTDSDRPDVQVRRGYNAFMAVDYACLVTYSNTPWAASTAACGPFQEKRAADWKRLREQVAEARRLGVSLCARSDEPKFAAPVWDGLLKDCPHPENAARLAQSGDTPRVDLTQELFWQTYRAKYRELMSVLPPEVRYVMVRTGENYSFLHAACKGQTLRDYLLPKDDQSNVRAMRRLIDETRRIVVDEGGRTLIWRTWDLGNEGFHADVGVYDAIVGGLTNKTGLVFSKKCTQTDYWEYNDFNPTIGRGGVEDIVEFQLSREYEGKSVFPNYLGFIYGRTLERLRRIPSVRGVWCWGLGEGGWGGPFAQTDLWYRLNAETMSRLLRDAAATPAEVLQQWTAENFGAEAASTLARVLARTHECVRMAFYIEAYGRKHRGWKPSENLLRDDVIRGGEATFRQIYGSCRNETDDIISEKRQASRMAAELLEEYESCRQAIVVARGEGRFDEGRAGFAYFARLCKVVEHYVCGAMLYMRFLESSKSEDRESARRELLAWRKSWTAYNRLPSDLKDVPTLYRSQLSSGAAADAGAMAVTCEYWLRELEDATAIRSAAVGGTSAFASCAVTEDLSAWVDPLIGTVGEGNAFPGACAPFGMIQAGPDTGTAVTPSGFKLTDETIRGFSQDHLNGTGGSDLGDVLLMPFTGGVERISFSSRYDRTSQVATPGFYSVRLTDAPVEVKATASERVAHWKFTWREGKEKGIFIDAASTLHRNHLKKYGPWIRSSEMRFAEDGRRITGSLEIRGWAERKVFYAMAFDRPFREARREPRDAFEGAGDRATVRFDLRDGETLNVRVALSTVSEKGALGNLEAESERTFDETHAATRAKWNEIFGRMTMEGTDAQKRSFYTALYHLCIQPNDIADADGRYRGADDAVKTAPDGHYYSTLSLWDTFRAAHPLYTLLVPERVDGFLRTMLEHGRTHGHLPVWTLWGRETHDMIAVHSIPVMVDAYLKGFKGIDWNEALDRMVVSLTKTRKDCPQGDWNVFWENGGYYPYRPGCWDEGWTAGGSCSRTLEVCYDWWCVEKLAVALGNERTRARAAERAAAWRKIFDCETGFIRPKGPAYEGAEWRTPFDPRLQLQKGDVIVGDYTEGNAWQYTWHVFQEPFALAELMGGVDKALGKLDEMFATPPVRPTVIGVNNDAGGLADKPGQLGLYWHGNEPSHHIAYLYSLFGRPERAAEIIRSICTECYGPKPDGLCGNDDCGQMAAWYVFSALGFYPLDPCGGEYVIGAPQVPRATLKLANGKTFTVTAKNLSKENKYVKSVMLNGKTITDWRVRHANIVNGGELIFEMMVK